MLTVHRKLLFLTSVVLLLLLLLPTSTTGFVWKAALDSATGQASSVERSAFSFAPAHDDRSVVQEQFQDMVREYPLWFSRPRVTLGLLRSDKETVTGNIHLKLRLGGITLLSFGRLRTTVQDPAVCSVVVPIVGGLLSLPPKTDDRDQNRGYLEFTLRSALDQDRRPAVSTTVETRIRGKYRPFLAGHPPVAFYRKALYRSTQSLAHAYVMWRFHRTVARMMHRACSKKGQRPVG